MFEEEDCFTKALDFLLKFKGEERLVKNGIVEYTLQIDAHNGSGFDTWIILSHLSCDKRIVDII